ncbi:MAG: hypothetical protein C4B58_04775 [Deltaproteobacteria bacterium]|nr:MAG: hypothetical protein C4B58_04775 [Deltaproteobacteria bacterium]
MNRTHLFFKREEFEADAIRKPHYIYKGYTVDRDGREICPVFLHFGKDEIVFSYRLPGDKVHRVFSLYVADGELNQRMLTRKVENYWKMPLWPTPEPEEKAKPEQAEGKEKDFFFLDRSLLSISFFSRLNNFDIKDNRFIESKLFDISERREGFHFRERSLEFHYVLEEGKKERAKKYSDKWVISDKGEFKTHYINFRRILLDFLYELENTNTFEDENFFKLQPALQNNKLLDALSRKCRYLDELYKLRDYKRTGPDKKLPKKFRNAEESWLNACFLEPYLEVFTSADSLFDTVEKEVERVFFKSRIGAIKRKRTQTFTQNDFRLRNQTATFFLRQYSLYNAFRTLLPPSVLGMIALLMILVPTGDLICKNILLPAGLFSFGLPFLALLGVIVYYAARRINLFKLMLPRMFLGIMLGWAMFWSTEESWKAAVVANAGGIAVVNVVLFVLLFLYVFTDICNKLIRVRDGAVLKRTVGVLVFAMLISFVQGFYVLQFMAKPMLENSGFLTSENLGIKKPETKLQNITKDEDVEITVIKPDLIKDYTLKFQTISSTVKEVAKHDNNVTILREQHNRKLFGISNYGSLPSFFGRPFYYIWSVHLSQFMMSILFGIVLQLLWEDRPITEPL